MATGVAGRLGRTVTSRVMEETRQGGDCVTTLSQLMAEETARGLQPRENTVTQTPVQVCIRKEEIG